MNGLAHYCREASPSLVHLDLASVGLDALVEETCSGNLGAPVEETCSGNPVDLVEEQMAPWEKMAVAPVPLTQRRLDNTLSLCREEPAGSNGFFAT